MNDNLGKYTPAVPKNWLQLLAGLIWSAVGIMLISFASRWLKPLDGSSTAVLAMVGSLLALAIYGFGFSKVARKNITRINAMPKERICLFAFQAWTSYPLVAFMILLGIYLRIYSSLPKELLAVLYLGIGLGLFLSSWLYYAQLVHWKGFPKREIT